MARASSNPSFNRSFAASSWVPRGAAGRVALHDGDNAADDAPAALSFVKDDALHGLPQPLVGFLFWCWVLQLSDHSGVMIVQMFGLPRLRSGQDAQNAKPLDFTFP